MRRKWIFFVAPPAVVVLIAICGEVVMHLWNWLLPMLFGWRTVTFWQALGLLVLCRILFGGFGNHGSDRHGPRQRMSERWERRRLGEQWESMTPEEREKMRQNLRSRCGGFAAPAGETKVPA